MVTLCPSWGAELERRCASTSSQSCNQVQVCVDFAVSVLLQLNFSGALSAALLNSFRSTAVQVLTPLRRQASAADALQALIQPLYSDCVLCNANVYVALDIDTVTLSVALRVLP